MEKKLEGTSPQEGDEDANVAIGKDSVEQVQGEDQEEGEVDETDAKSEAANEEKNDPAPKSTATQSASSFFSKIMNSSPLTNVMKPFNLVAVATSSQEPNLTPKCKQLKENNEQLKKILTQRYSQMYKDLNGEMQHLNQPLTRTLNIAQDISIHMRSFNEELNTLMNNIQDLYHEFLPTEQNIPIQ